MTNDMAEYKKIIMKGDIVTLHSRFETDFEKLHTKRYDLLFYAAAHTRHVRIFKFLLWVCGNTRAIQETCKALAEKHNNQVMLHYFRTKNKTGKFNSGTIRA